MKMKPSIQRRRDALQLSYDVPHRIFSAKVYPSLSPNGSTIIIYAHEEGLRVLWRGGKPFKSGKILEDAPKVNGTSKDQDVIVDLDDETSAINKVAPLPAEFEDEDVEVDPSSPYHAILRHIDVSLGTSARHIAIPHHPPNISDISPGAYPPILSTHIVIAATCTDCSICVVSLPKTPPSPVSDDPSAWGIKILKILGPNTHQDLPSGVTITHTAAPVDSDDEAGQSKSRSHSRTRLINAAAASSGVSNPGRSWSLLLATTSPNAGGILLIHQIPLTAGINFSTSSEFHYPIQRQYLRFPTAGSSITFNPSPYPAERHSNILISNSDTGCVKVYQTLNDTSPISSRGRRGSAATLDSVASGSYFTRSSSVQSGKFLITLYPGFIRPMDSSEFSRRKRIIDVSWVLGGCAILTLLEDGEWGVWDVEGAGPSSSVPKGLLSGQTNSYGIQGGALTGFAISGKVPSAGDEAPKTQQNGLTDAKSGQLAPMTPHTRKLRSDRLFGGNSTKKSSRTGHGEYAQGCLCVTELVTSTLSVASAVADESILLNYSGTNVSIPSLLSFWHAEKSGKGTLGSGTAGRPSFIDEASLGGERQIGIAKLFPPQESKPENLFGFTKEAAPDILITTEHRLIMLVTAILEPISKIPEEQSGSMTMAPTSTGHDDQLLLTHGDLDIEGMDRILDGMVSEQGKAVNGIGKGVGFDVDVDGDVGMATPTPKANGRLGRTRGTMNLSNRGGRGRLFT